MQRTFMLLPFPSLCERRRPGEPQTAANNKRRFSRNYLPSSSQADAAFAVKVPELLGVNPALRYRLCSTGIGSAICWPAAGAVTSGPVSTAVKVSLSSLCSRMGMNPSIAANGGVGLEHDVHVRHASGVLRCRSVEVQHIRTIYGRVLGGEPQHQTSKVYLSFCNSLQCQHL